MKTFLRSSGFFILFFLIENRVFVKRLTIPIMDCGQASKAAFIRSLFQGG
jgi:hypothetical protein|tara:strand:- start:348 stop:497 length:150 start_codon:yes stop_codon:yes gene_type:complete